MRSSFLSTVIASIWCAFLLPFLAAAVRADEPLLADKDIDVRLVIDVSGSMKLNDPQNLRQPAVDLMLRLLPDGSRAGIWTFGKWVNMLVAHGEVGKQWRNNAKGGVPSINSVGLFTNIGEALEKAAYDAATSDPRQIKNIILLTDGMVDIDKDPELNRKEWRRIIDTVLPKLKEAGYRIHTIALSENADKDLMNKLALATDGVSEVALNAEDLMKIFLKAFDASVPAEQVPIADNRFFIDSSVEEFTALIFRRSQAPTSLISSDQQIWAAQSKDEDLNWYHTDKYDLITVRHPLEGEWGINADMEPGSRITVVSNLNLRVNSLPNNLLIGAALDLKASLQEDGKILKDANFLSLMDIQASITTQNSDTAETQQLWRKALVEKTLPQDGVFSKTLPEFKNAGVYFLEVEVDGKTFKRSFKQQINVREAFSAEIRKQFSEGQEKFILTVNAFQGDIDYKKTQVLASIMEPDNRNVLRPLTESGLDSWVLELMPELEGSYLARVQVKGKLLSGESFSHELSPLSFEYSADGSLREKPRLPEPSEVEQSSPEPTPAPKATPSKVVIEAEKNEKLPDWMVYAVLGVGNFLLIVFAYLVYRKIMRKDDLTDDVDVESELKKNTPAPASANMSPAEAKPVAATQMSIDEDEDEPPMEDLDPDLDAVPPRLATLDEDEASAADLSSSLDDLDAMAVEQMAESTASETAEEDDEASEDDDMVQAMLKAQGLDLAEEELDDAISSLIDDLETDDEEDKN